MKERVRQRWIVRENFSCINCNAGNKYIRWNERGSKHPKLEPEGVLFCKRCRHLLTTKKELEKLVPYVEYQEFSFYLRFISEHFTPCRKCQSTIEEALNVKVVNLRKLKDWEINVDTFYCPIELDDFVDDLRFWFKWVGKASAVFIPCKTCQVALKKLIEYADKWIIGNKDYFPPIELSRRWKINDNKTQAIEKGLIRFNGKHNFGKCERCGELGYLEKDMWIEKWICETCRNVTKALHVVDTS